MAQTTEAKGLGWTICSLKAGMEESTAEPRRLITTRTRPSLSWFSIMRTRSSHENGGFFGEMHRHTSHEDEHFFQF